MIKKNDIDASLAKKIRRIANETSLTNGEVIDAMLQIAIFIQIYVDCAKRQNGYNPYFDINAMNEKQIEDVNKELYAEMFETSKKVVPNVSIDCLLNIYLNRSPKIKNAADLINNHYTIKRSFLDLVQDKLMNDSDIDEAIILDTLFQHKKYTEKIGYLKQLRMPIEDLVKYHCERRKEDYEDGVMLKGINARKKMYPVVKGILKIDQLSSKEKIVDMTSEEVKIYNSEDKGNKIYACTHIGGNDIQRTLQTINVPAYLMLGDPGILYKKLIYQALRFNGVIPLETKDRKDRKFAYDRSIELLENDGNLLIYPEGAWNVLPNVLVMKLFRGTVRMAKETGKPIVPIALEQIGDTFYIKVGKQYTIDKDSNLSEEELTYELRDKLATLKWEILESQPLTNRSDIPDGYLKTFQDGIVNKCNYGYGFSLEDALSEAFHDKNVTEYLDAFSFMDNIELTKENAFLARGQQYYKSRKN